MATVDALITYTFPLLGGSSPSVSSTSAPPSTKTDDSTTTNPTDPPSPDPDPPAPLTYTHPLPSSLLTPPHPSSPQHASYTSELTDILTTLNHLHHSAALTHLLTVSPLCANPACGAGATDLLKTATPLLALAEPIIVVACAGICTSAQCNGIVRGLLTAKTQRKTAGTKAGWEGNNNEGCAQCGRKQGGGVRKCGGCGVVQYCGEKCQRRGWRGGHRDVCGGLRAMGQGRKEEGEGKVETQGEGKRKGEGKGGEVEMEEVGDPEDELWEE